MATLRKKRKLAAVSRETHENTRSSQSHNTLDPEMAQEYISQFSEEIEGGVTETLSKEFSRTESRILGALSEDDEFLLHRQLRTCSVAVPGTSRNSDSENREPNGDRSPNDPCPKARISSHCSGILVISEVEEYPRMVAGGPEEIRNRPYIVIEIQEEIPHCSPGTSSGKQKKARSTSQPQFSIENTPATVEADQILLALQQFNRISKLPKTLTTAMPTFDGKSEKFELLEDLFQTSLKFFNQLTKEDK